MHSLLKMVTAALLLGFISVMVMGNIQDAEERHFDINGTSIVFSGSIPRDIGSIWSIVFEDTHLSIIDKIEAAGHKIDGFKVQSDGQTVASIGTDGIFIEARYQVPEEVTMGGSPQALQFHLDTQIEDLSAMTGTFSGVRISDVLLDQVGPLLKRWRSTGRPVRSALLLLISNLLFKEALPDGLSL